MRSGMLSGVDGSISDHQYTWMRQHMSSRNQQDQRDSGSVTTSLEIGASNVENKEGDVDDQGFIECAEKNKWKVFGIVHTIDGMMYVTNVLSLSVVTVIFGLALLGLALVKLMVILKRRRTMQLLLQNRQCLPVFVSEGSCETGSSSVLAVGRQIRREVVGRGQIMGQSEVFDGSVNDSVGSYVEQLSGVDDDAVEIRAIWRASVENQLHVGGVDSIVQANVPMRWIKREKSNGLTEKEIKAIERTSFSEEEIKNLEEKNVCAICLEKFEADRKVFKLACSHLYHNHCLKDWLSKESKCPLCRFELKKSTNLK